MTSVAPSSAPSALREVGGVWLRRAIAAYEAFASLAPDSDAREFTAWHNGCRAALAHIEALLRLERFVCPSSSPPDGALGGMDDARRLVAQAREALRREESGVAGTSSGVCGDGEEG